MLYNSLMSMFISVTLLFIQTLLRFNLVLLCVSYVLMSYQSSDCWHSSSFCQCLVFLCVYLSNIVFIKCLIGVYFCVTGNVFVKNKVM